MSSDGKIYCVPGDCLCASDAKHTGGDGTYIRMGHIFSSNAGVVKIEELDDGHKVISVVNPHSEAKRVPTVGSVVTCRITSIGAMNAKATIIWIEDQELRHTFKGIIRKEDIREMDKSTVEVHKCFRPGDIVLARVVGITENNVYSLSTAEDELGVAVAYSSNHKDTQMIPVNWTQMRCPKTYVKELRKVAKIRFD